MDMEGADLIPNPGADSYLLALGAKLAPFFLSMQPEEGEWHFVTFYAKKTGGSVIADDIRMYKGGRQVTPRPVQQTLDLYINGQKVRSMQQVVDDPSVNHFDLGWISRPSGTGPLSIVAVVGTEPQPQPVNAGFWEMKDQPISHDHPQSEGRLPTGVGQGEEPGNVPFQGWSPEERAPSELFQAPKKVEQRCEVGSYGGCLTHKKPNARYCLDTLYARIEQAEAKEGLLLERLRTARQEIAGYANSAIGSSKLALRILDVRFPEIRAP